MDYVDYPLIIVGVSEYIYIHTYIHTYMQIFKYNYTIWTSLKAESTTTANLEILQASLVFCFARNLFSVFNRKLIFLPSKLNTFAKLYKTDENEVYLFNYSNKCFTSKNKSKINH